MSQYVTEKQACHWARDTHHNNDFIVKLHLIILCTGQRLGNRIAAAT